MKKTFRVPSLVSASAMGVGPWLACRKNASQQDFGKMKQQLLRLLVRDGYQAKMKCGNVVVTYEEADFALSFSESLSGSRYARVAVIGHYELEGVEEMNPFIVDAFMGHINHWSFHLSNMFYKKNCLLSYCTDVCRVADFYSGLRAIFDLMIANEREARRFFEDYRERVRPGKKPHEVKPIGFCASSGEAHRVAAEATADVE